MNINEEPPKEMKRDSLKTSSFFNILIKVLAYLFPLILSPYLYRTLGVAGIGQYTYEYSYVSYFMLVASFGFDTYGAKEITINSDSKEKLTQRFWSLYISKMIFGFVCLIVYYSLIFSRVFGDESSFLSYSLLSMFIIGTMTDITFFFTGIEKFKSISLKTLLVKLVSFILVFIFVHSNADYIAYVCIMSVSFLLASLVMYFPLRTYIGRPSKIGLSLWGDIKASSAFFVPALAVTAYATFGKTFLGLFYDNTQVGYYESAVKLESVFTSISFAVVPVLLSRNSYLISRGEKEQSAGVINKAFNALMDFSLPCCIGLFCIANVFIPLFFGADDTPAVPMLRILCFSIPFVVISSIVNYAYLIPYGKMKLVNLIPLSVCLSSLLASFLMIKYIGPVGAAYATLFTEILSALLFFLFSRKAIPYKEVGKRTLRPLIASLLMGGFYYGINKLLCLALSPKISMVIDILLSALLYFALLFLFKDPFFYGFMCALKEKMKGRKQK